MSSCINNQNTSVKTHQVLLQSVYDMEGCRDWSVNHNRVKPVSDGNVLRWKYQRWLLPQSCYIAQLSFTWGCYTLLMPTVHCGSLSKILVVHCFLDYGLIFAPGYIQYLFFLRQSSYEDLVAQTHPWHTMTITTQTQRNIPWNPCFNGSKYRKGKWALSWLWEVLIKSECSNNACCYFREFNWAHHF